MNRRISVVNWDLRRLILSYGANLYSRIVTGLPVSDATGGFKCFRRSALEALDFSKMKSDGYCFQIETSFKVWKKKMRVAEIPIVFTDRTKGESKMSGGIISEAFFLVIKLRLGLA
jgi:dolichol-phosphate mannosyltransferase